LPNSSESLPLKLGDNEYFGYQINAAQVITVRRGLCYKLEFLNKSIPANIDSGFWFMMTTSLQGTFTHGVSLSLSCEQSKTFVSTSKYSP
jgi:hypothetical protein